MNKRDLIKVIGKTCGRRRSIPAALVNYVSDNVEAEEEVVAASPAVFQARKGLFLITSQRLVFYSCGFLGTVNVAEFGLGAVSSVSYELRFMSGAMRLRIAKDEVFMEGLTRHATRNLAASLQRTRKVPNVKPDRHEAPEADEVARITRLYQLYRGGALTRSEFELLKERLVDKGEPLPAA